MGRVIFILILALMLILIIYGLVQTLDMSAAE
jgi:hypothetical protein